ncbi:methanol oxidation system protein MoxJ [Methylocystis sp. L43]|uniref:methanol oxidation system protein MoxJ n=1 Tax=unclassified Methylocystis TaxID=2625913 RepID=UPI0018C21E03|nr:MULTISPECIES: methanol oxidation system protein MoxJ [unclassified Methylocystis]MBG0799130.1 methanol oxidation system protein MoxJ [Methylocystis sp. L43]MBG0806494.1 methanol oxidation system protein MoxJ [Methylocystis sp. H15]
MSRFTRLPAGACGALFVALAAMSAEGASLGVAGDAVSNAATASAAEPSDPNTLRICAAKNQPPLSMEDGSGLENKIGVALADAMKRKAQFVWSQQPAIYLVRDSLDKKLCDVVIGLDTGDPRVATSKPYYRTGYVFVSRADRDLDIKSWSDARLKKLGHVVVAFGSPGEMLLKDMGQYEDNMAYLYSLVNFKSARNQYTQIDPARMVGEVVSGAAEVAVGFAPDVARYVKASSTPLRMTLIEDDAVKSNGEKVPQRFDQSVAVRRDDKALLTEIDQALVAARPKIDDILKAEGVPLLPVTQ